jgi:formiminotetrahydrofolate cyclodeaminase
LLEGDDAAPSAAVLEDKALVETQYEEAIRKFNQFVAEDAKAFNNAMAARKLTGIVTGEALEP